jgi:hypothetical protein
MSDERLRQSYDMLLGVRSGESADRSHCPPVEELQALVHREQEEEARLALLDHVMACPFCQPEFELLRAASRASGERATPDGE